MDRLLNDKTELTKRCELFAEELKAVERKFQMKIEEMEDHGAKELAKNKQNWIATERMKRESWEKEKVGRCEKGSDIFFLGGGCF